LSILTELPNGGGSNVLPQAHHPSLRIAEGSASECLLLSSDTASIQPPWAKTQRELLGQINRVDPCSAYWDEEGFLASHPQYTGVWGSNSLRALSPD